MLLTGTFLRSLDEKHRFSIPKPIREALGQSHRGIVYLTPGTDGSLALYPEATFASLADQLGRGSPTSQDVRTFSRLFYSQAQRIETDRQGRVRVPQSLVELASLQGEIVLLGVRDHLEVWDREMWGRYLSAKQPSYDEIAENAFGGGGPGDASGGERTTPGGVDVWRARPTSPR